VRDALLAVALLTAAAAALRARPVAGGALATAGFVLAGLGFAGAAWLPVEPWARGPLGLWAVAVVGKAAALGRERPGSLGPGRGLAYLAIWPWLDPALAFRPRPGLPRGPAATKALLGVVEVAIGAAVAVASLRLGWLEAPEPFPSWARCAAFVPVVDGAFRATAGAASLAGLASQETFRAPWKMTDLADFWGRRWNRFVSRSLAVEVYGPLRRRAGRVAAVLGVFLGSGVLHEVLFRLPVVDGPDGRYTAFFLAQGAAVVALAALLPGPGRSRAGRLSRRAAAWAVLLATSPLFFGGCYPSVLPLERVLG
jgi:hypothetical protein